MANINRKRLDAIEDITDDDISSDEVWDYLRDIKERLKDVEEESERRRLAIENLLLQALENGKENERLTKKIGELFKERDELYDKYVHIHSKACDGYRC